MRIFLKTEGFFEYATCGRKFFQKRRKKTPFSKISAYVWTGPQHEQAKGRTMDYQSTEDTAVRAECTPDGYKIIDSPRVGRSGGGIAVVYRTELSVTEITAGERSSFEFAEYIVVADGVTRFRLIIYRPPYSKAILSRYRHSWTISLTTWNQ